MAVARVAFTLIAFNVARIAKTAQGERLTNRGIRRLRRELMAECGPAPLIVFTTEALRIFHTEEVAEALGAPPASSLRRHPGTTRARAQPLSQIVAAAGPRLPLEGKPGIIDGLRDQMTSGAVWSSAPAPQCVIRLQDGASW